MKLNYDSIISTLSANLGVSERVLSLAGGSWLLYRALKKKETGIMQTAAAGFMLFRGVTGYGLIAEDNRQSRRLNKNRKMSINTRMKINMPREEIYEYWRNLENLPLFMDHLESVTEKDDKTSEWKAKLPAGIGSVSWKSEIIDEEPNEHLSWRSLPDSTIENEGSVKFREVGEFETQVDATITYSAPMGKAGEKVAQFFNPQVERMVRDDLRNFKKHMEIDKGVVMDGQNPSKKPNYSE